MTTPTEQTYRQRILQVQLFIQDHLDEELPLDRVARVAHFSSYHFHRIFRGLVGEGVNEYVRRLRLEAAAVALKTTDWSVLDIALRAGYNAHDRRSSAAFTGPARAGHGGRRRVAPSTPEGDSSSRDPDENRTSVLMNSLLSHKTRRYGHWTRMRFINEVDTSQFVCFAERDAAAFTLAAEGDPRQDDYDIWLGTDIIRPWIASTRHTMVANYLYLDGHAVSLPWDQVVVDMYPDKVVLTQDGNYPN